MSNSKVKISDNNLQVLLASTPAKRQSEVEEIYREKGYVEAVSYLWDEVLDEESKLEAEHAVGANDSGNKFYKLLVTDFNIKEHFSQVCSHRKFIKKAYKKLGKYLEHMKEEGAVKHDLSNFILAQAVGFTVRWVHGTDNESRKAALNHHFCNEPHHPQYYKERMEMRYLEESLVDMAASRWERQLGGKDDAAIGDIVNFNAQFLERYHADDRKVLLNLIEKKSRR